MTAPATPDRAALLARRQAAWGEKLQVQNKDFLSPADWDAIRAYDAEIAELTEQLRACRPTVAELVASTDAFRRFLRGLYPSEPFARSCNACACPIAKWLEAELGFPVTVNRQEIIPDFGDNVPASAWVARFIDQIDRLNEGHREVTITPAQALAVLDRVAP